MKLIKKTLKFILVFIALIALVVLLFLAITSAVRKYEQHNMIHRFSNNSTLFEAFISGERDIDYIKNGSIHYTVTPQFEELGIESIYEEFEDTILFEQKNRLLGMFPHGIIYVKNKDILPKWIFVEPIFEYS